MHHLYLILKLGRRNFAKKTYGNKLAMRLEIQQAHRNPILKKSFRTRTTQLMGLEFVFVSRVDLRFFSFLFIFSRSSLKTQRVQGGAVSFVIRKLE